MESIRNGGLIDVEKAFGCMIWNFLLYKLLLYNVNRELFNVNSGMKKGIPFLRRYSLLVSLTL